MQVLISGYTTLKNGDVKDKIEVNVVVSGTSKGNFKKYSGGEQVRVKVCGILTLHTLINNAAPHGKGLNFLAIDELDWLDSQGQVEIIKILCKAGISTVLVMHHINNFQYDFQKVYIEKVKGVSRIKNENIST